MLVLSECVAVGAVPQDWNFDAKFGCHSVDPYRCIPGRVSFRRLCPKWLRLCPPA